MPTEQTFERAFIIGDRIDLDSFLNRIELEASQKDQNPLAPALYKRLSDEAHSQRNTGEMHKIAILKMWESDLSLDYPMAANWVYNQVAVLEKNIQVDLANREIEKKMVTTNSGSNSTTAIAPQIGLPKDKRALKISIGVGLGLLALGSLLLFIPRKGV